MTSRSLALLVAVLLAGVVVGCAQTHPHASRAQKLSLASTSPAPSPPSTSPALKSAIPISGESLGGDQDYYAVDNGPMPHASGSVHVSKSGVPLSYIVVAGDTESGIAARFGLPTFENVFQLNSARRYCPDPNGNLYLYVGDVINLDPHTLTTVGTINGHTCKGTLPSPMPAQESAAEAWLHP